jgi:hypothetical protein
VCVCVSAKQKLGQEQAKYARNAKSSQEPGSQLELDGFSATHRNTETLYSLSIYTCTVCDWKQGGRPCFPSRGQWTVYSHTSPFTIFTSGTQCCHLSKEDGRVLVDDTPLQLYHYCQRLFYCKKHRRNLRVSLL